MRSSLIHRRGCNLFYYLSNIKLRTKYIYIYISRHTYLDKQPEKLRCIYIYIYTHKKYIYIYLDPSHVTMIYHDTSFWTQRRHLWPHGHPPPLEERQPHQLRRPPGVGAVRCFLKPHGNPMYFRPFIGVISSHLYCNW